MCHDRTAAAALLAVGLAALAGCRSGPALGRPADEPPVALKDGEVADVQIALARTLENRGEVTQAIQMYSEAVKRNPQRADAYARLAVLSDKQAMFAESAEYHAKAVALRPDDPDLHCNRGYSLYLQHRWVDAAQALQRAVELKPDHPRALTNLGLALARAGQGKQALEVFRRAGRTEAEAHANVAYALSANGDFADARTHYAAALAADPGLDVAKGGLARLDALAGRSPKPTGDIVQTGATVPAGDERPAGDGRE